jgi:hypothetical protein
MQSWNCYWTTKRFCIADLLFLSVTVQRGHHRQDKLICHTTTVVFYKNNEMRQIAPYTYVHFQNHMTREMILTRQMKITTDYRERAMLCELSDLYAECCSQTEHSAFDEVIPLFKGKSHH